MTLTFVVNGELVPIEAESTDLLCDVVAKAIVISKYDRSSKHDRSMDDLWTLRYESGVLIRDWLLPVGAYGFVADAQIWLAFKDGSNS